MLVALSRLAVGSSRRTRRRSEGEAMTLKILARLVPRLLNPLRRWQDDDQADRAEDPAREPALHHRASRGLSRLRPSDVELEQVRTDMIDQLDRFARQQLSADGLDFDTWLRRTVVDQEEWLARIVFRKQ
jgi:hypothetical protein